MLKVLKWCQTRKQIVQRVSKLTISPKPVGKDKSKFYSEFYIKLPTTFMLYDFSDKHLKVVEKFSLGRLFQLDKFAEGYYKFENTKVGSLKILIFLQQLGILRSYISYYNPNLIWSDFHILKIRGNQNFQITQIC